MGRQRKPLGEIPPIRVSPQAKGALNRFEAAVREHAWIGSQHPDDHAAIENRLARTKAKLLEFLQY